ncbi:MAG: DUF4266 domain-containing protein [Verrucomicrobiales bacterium]
MKFLLLLAPLVFLTSCAKVSPWERGNLSKKCMSPDRDPLGDSMSEHMYFSREASLGGNGVGGGGCGCN